MYPPQIHLRSPQFCQQLLRRGLTTLALADVPPDQRAGATTLMSMTIQISLSAGVAVAAMFTNLSMLVRGEDMLTGFDLRVALFLIGVIGAGSTLWFMTLSHDAAREVSGHSGSKKAIK